MTNDHAAEAREGLLDTVAGKAKEVAGAVTGRDDLVEEGQLQQAEARNRREAVAESAVAAAKRDEAVEGLQETRQETAAQRQQADAVARQEEAAAERERAAKLASAEREADRREAEGLEAAEERADDVAARRADEADRLDRSADATEEQTAAERARLEREAADAEARAAQLRAQNEN